MSCSSREDAAALDKADPLAPVRERFSLPDKLIYLDGNSLGALPAHVGQAVQDGVARQWGSDLITSWNGNDWWGLPERVGDRIGALVGAAPGQVVCGDSTSVQLFQALTALARMRPGRGVLVTDGGNFPTDQYIVDSVARMTNRRVERVTPSEARFDDDTAVVAFSVVDYRTGELWDVDDITRRAHDAGALVLWDVCHAAGALPIQLDALAADAAVGCSYKYLNGGPGAPAWLYLPERHQHTADMPLTGWQGRDNPFGLNQTYEPAAGITRGRIGTPPILSMLALEAALDVWGGVDQNQVREKSLALSDLLLARADQLGIEAATPREHHRRGSQVSLRHEHAYEITQALIARGVIGDFRAPDLVRLGLTPLYLRYVDVWDAMGVLADVLHTKAYTDPAYARGNSVVT